MAYAVPSHDLHIGQLKTPLAAEHFHDVVERESQMPITVVGSCRTQCCSLVSNGQYNCSAASDIELHKVLARTSHW